MTSFFSRNHMTFEFGYDPNEEDEVKIKEMISKIAKRFNFILINEFMAESLIVLRRYLCMDLPGKVMISRNFPLENGRSSD